MDKETIYNQYRQKILILIRMKTNYDSDSEDICHDVLEAVIKAVQDGKINNPEKLPAYINSICYNKIADWMRRKYIRKEIHIGDLEIFDPDQDTLNKLIDEEQRNHLDNAFKRLNLRERKVLYLHYYHNWGFEKIASIMNLKSTTARKTAERARQKIAKKFNINY